MLGQIRCATVTAFRQSERTADLVAKRVRRGRVVGRSGALAIAVVLLLATGVALAATHFAKGALYTGRSCRGDAGLPGATCVYKFRASRDGLTLGFVGKTVVSTWICHGGGGEALIGGKLHGAAPVPLVKLRSNGTALRERRARWHQGHCDWEADACRQDRGDHVPSGTVRRAGGNADQALIRARGPHLQRSRGAT